MTKRQISAVVFAICATALLAGCAKNADGSRMTMAQQWKSWADRQDAAARNFVDTDRDSRDFARTTPSSGIPDAEGRFRDSTTF